MTIPTTLTIITTILFTTFLLILQSPRSSAASDEFIRLMKRNRDLISRMDGEDFPKIALQLQKFECHSLFTGGFCTYIVGGGLEQHFPTTSTPPNRNHQRPLRHQVTKHLTTGPNAASVAQNVLVEALARQYFDEEKSRKLASVGNRSIPDQFADPLVQQTAKEHREAGKQLQVRVFDDKHDTDSHVLLKKRQRFSHYIFPDDPITSKRPSHSPSYLSTLLGNSPHSANPGTSPRHQPQHPPPLRIEATPDGQVTIAATLDLEQFLPVDRNDKIGAKKYMASMTDGDIEATKLLLEQQIRAQMEHIQGLDEAHIEGIVIQMQLAYENALREQIKQAKATLVEVTNQEELDEILKKHIALKAVRDQQVASDTDVATTPTPTADPKTPISTTDPKTPISTTDPKKTPTPTTDHKTPIPRIVKIDGRELDLNKVKEYILGLDDVNDDDLPQEDPSNPKKLTPTAIFTEEMVDQVRDLMAKGDFAGIIALAERNGVDLTKYPEFVRLHKMAKKQNITPQMVKEAQDYYLKLANDPETAELLKELDKVSGSKILFVMNDEDDEDEEWVSDN